MEELETLKQQMQKQEKLASLGLLSAGIAHEIQNPLNFVINFSKMSDKLLRDLTEVLEENEEKLSAEDREEVDDIIADLQENLQKIAEHGNRAISIIRGILLVSRGKENERLPVDICHLVKEYIWLSYHAMRAKYHNFNISIREHYQEQIPEMMVVPQDLSRAVLNVMNNACYAVRVKKEEIPEGYDPTVEVSVTSNGKEVEITVSDNGIGMNEEVQQHVYENFYTTKPIGEGTGLGMSLTRDIIEKHGGNITFQSTEGEGTSFTFKIPLS